MFNSLQERSEANNDSLKDCENGIKNEDFTSGTTFVLKLAPMNLTTLHRKLLILIGILVAVGVAVVLLGGISSADVSVAPSRFTFELSFDFTKQVVTHLLRGASSISK